jgi:hypothetical protein
MVAIEFEGSSRLKRIGERAFAGCELQSITIPASTEEITGSAFVDCPLIEIQVAPGSMNFKVEGSLLVTSDGTTIVRYFGMDSGVVVGREVRVIGKSSFEGCEDLGQITFESGSKLEEIGAAALRDCESVVGIELPSSVRIIGEASFEGCTQLEYCLIAKDSSLVTIGVRAFVKCSSMRSFDIPGRVGEIGSNCFSECVHLYQLKFGSSELLKRMIGDRSLDDALDEFGVSATSTLFRIDVEGGGVDLQLPGWVSVRNGDGALETSLVRALE